jgi:UDP-MurNAc hydroxylase
MRVEWFRSATVGISSRAGTSVLCDPWLTDGAFLGSWYHFPPLKGHEFDEVLNRPWDAVFISHLHADHFDRKFLSALARAQPECTAIIPSFAHPWLRRALRNCGFDNDRLLEIESGSTCQVKDVTIQVLTADHCDPETCGISVPCHREDTRLAALDSLALFEADGQKILNANDALAVASVGRVLPMTGSVDLLLGHYGGAGPFPQCFPDITADDKLAKARALADVFLSRLASAALVTRAKYLMPYAGQYVLGGRLAQLNPFRSVVPLAEAVRVLTEKSESRVIAIEPFSSFDLDDGVVERPWVEPAQGLVDEYVSRISHNLYPYEKASISWPEAEDDLRDALKNVAREYLRRRDIGREYGPHRLSIETPEVQGSVTFDQGESTVSMGPLPAMVESETRIACHHALLKGLIQRAEGYEGFTPMHFNQAEIGSHFTWRRNGEYSDVVHCLNFLQTTRGRSRLESKPNRSEIFSEPQHANSILERPGI